jgi:hypothetical protein
LVGRAVSTIDSACGPSSPLLVDSVAAAAGVTLRLIQDGVPDLTEHDASKQVETEASRSSELLAQSATVPAAQRARLPKAASDSHRSATPSRGLLPGLASSVRFCVRLRRRPGPEGRGLLLESSSDPWSRSSRRSVVDVLPVFAKLAERVRLPSPPQARRKAYLLGPASTASVAPEGTPVTEDDARSRRLVAGVTRCRAAAPRVLGATWTRALRNTRPAAPCRWGAHPASRSVLRGQARSGR